METESKERGRPDFTTQLCLISNVPSQTAAWKHFSHNLEQTCLTILYKLSTPPPTSFNYDRVVFFLSRRRRLRSKRPSRVRGTPGKDHLPAVAQSRRRRRTRPGTGVGGRRRRRRGASSADVVETRRRPRDLHHQLHVESHDVRTVQVHVLADRADGTPEEARVSL